MVKRGLSAAEKKEKLKAIFHSTLEPHTLKQIEKLGQKAGVTQMTIKDILGEMVADNEVELDKIGSTNWYWSFPSKELANLQNAERSLTQQLEQLATEKKSCEKRKADLLVDRQPTEKRAKSLEELASLRAEYANIQASIAKLKENDPNKVLEVAKQSETCKIAAERWTDNVFALLSYIKKKFGKSSKEARVTLQLSDDFDYVEYVHPKTKKPAKASI